MAAKKQESKADDNSEIVQFVEKARTLRLQSVCITVVLCLAVIAWTLTKIYARPTAWELFWGFLGALGAPSVIFVIGIKVHLKYVRKNARRTRSFEEMADPNRTSSDLGEKRAEEQP